MLITSIQRASEVAYIADNKKAGHVEVPGLFVE
jgi:hypothetical protein